MERRSGCDQRAPLGDVASGDPMPTRPDVHDIVAASLQTDGQRYTGSRRKLVEILAHAGRPLSIPDVLAAEAALPQSSVYRNLVVLEQAGAVGRLLAPDGAPPVERQPRIPRAGPGDGTGARPPAAEKPASHKIRLVLKRDGPREGGRQRPCPSGARLETKTATSVRQSVLV